MSVPAYEVMFGKLPRRNLFEDYFDHAGSMTSRIMLKPLEDPHVDLIANVSSETWLLITTFCLFCCIRFFKYYCFCPSSVGI